MSQKLEPLISDSLTLFSLLHDSRVIWLGDLNYRVALSYDETRVLLEDNDWDALLERDQVCNLHLIKQLIMMRCFLIGKYKCKTMLKLLIIWCGIALDISVIA